MKLFLIASVLFTVSLLRKEILGQDLYSCDPSEDCSKGNAAPGSKVPDPANCTKYYLCLQGGDGSLFPSDDSESCSEGEYFDWDLGDCIDDEGATCKNLCINLCNISCTAEGEQVAVPGDCGSYYFCTTDTDNNRLLAPCETEFPYFDGVRCQNDSSKCCDTCTPYCEEEYIETRNPQDCTEYFLCTSKGIPEDKDLHSCPNAQHFDPNVGRCVSGDECDVLCPATLF